MSGELNHFNSIDLFKIHVKNLNIDELKHELDEMLVIYQRYKDDIMYRMFYPDTEKEMLARQKIVKDELDKRIEEELLGDELDR